MKRHRALAAVVLAVGLLVTASAVLAGTTASIRGNARANTIRGTAAADSIWGLGGNDKLYGGAGNDKLYGGAGNDLLVGGPGADVLSCGAGADTAVGDAKDKATKDCEKTRGIPAPGGGGEGGGGGGGTPPPTPKAICSNGTDDDGDGKIDFPADPGCESASDTDETDPAAPVTAGSYKGATQEGNFVFFTVTPDRTLTGYRVNAVSEQCQPANIELRGAIDWTKNTFLINRDGSVAAEGSWTGSDKEGDAEYTAWSGKVTARFVTAASVEGTLIISDELNYGGQHFRCSTGEVKWSATIQS